MPRPMGEFLAIWAEIEPRTQERRGRLGKWAAGAWIEIALCFVAVFGLGSTLLGDFQKVREFDYVATDYKTLYASSALYREGGNPYDAPALMAIYHRDGVVLPRTTFGRMPVYPPPTLLVLWPLTYLPMGASADAWWVVSMAVTAAALAMLVGEARRQGLNWLYRLGLIAFTVASPMLGYTFNIGNVSPTVGALCTIALMLAVRESQAGAKAGTTAWLTAGGCLGLALCLKPHMAVWIAAGIALVGGRSGRRIAAVGVALFGGCTVLSMALVWSRGALHMVLGSFLAMLAQERASGSMSAESRELLPVLGQLTGLDSLLGLHVGQPLQGWLVGAALAAC